MNIAEQRHKPAFMTDAHQYYLYTYRDHKVHPRQLKAHFSKLTYSQATEIICWYYIDQYEIKRI